MARLHPDILSGLLSLEPLAPRSAAAGIDPGQAGAFEQFLDQARRAAGEQDAAGSTPPKPASAEQDRTNERSAPRRMDERASPSSAAASSPETADQARADHSGKPVASQESDHASQDSTDQPQAPGGAVQEPADKKEDRHRKREKSDDAPAAAASGAAAIAPIETVQEKSPDGGPNAAEGETATAVRKDRGRGPLPEKGQGAADAQGQPADAAAAAVAGGDKAVAEPSPNSKDQAAETIAATEQARTEAGQPPAGQASARAASGQQATEAMPESGAGPRRREAKQAAKDAAANRPGEGAGGDPAGQGKAVQADQPAVAAAESPVAAAAPIDASKETGGPTNKPAPSDRPAQADGPARATADSSSRSASGRHAPGAPGTSQADRVRFVERVARAFQSVGQRGGSIRLRLHPPELGSVRVEVTVRNGAMAARMEAETPEARTALLENLPALRDRLAEHNIKVDRFDVDLADRSAGGTPQGPGGDSQPRNQGGRQPRSQGGSRQSDTERPVQPRAAVRPGEASRLDVFI